MDLFQPMSYLNHENDSFIYDEIKKSNFTNVLMIGHKGLREFPQKILRSHHLEKIYRIDLSHNNLSMIPRSISDFSNLRELWINNNPLEKFPENIHLLKKLEFIDIRNTKIEDIPFELAILDDLYEIDWRGTPLEKNLKEKHDIEVNDFISLKSLLDDSYKRDQLEKKLFEELNGEHFILDSDRPDIEKLIWILVKTLSDAFQNLNEFEQYTRRASKLLPNRIDEIQYNKTIEKSKEMFFEFKRDTDRKRLAADVEIKIRNIYFDQIERHEVTQLLDSIFDNVSLLEDVQFLIQYCVQLFPKEPKDATGELIWENIQNLQHELTLKREAAIHTLITAMTQLYPEQRPENIKSSAIEISKYFQKERFANKKELDRMSQLAADCDKILPPDYASLNAKRVYEDFRKMN